MNEILKQQFGCSLVKEYAYLMNGKDKAFVVNKDVDRVDLGKIRVDRLGLYFAEWKNTQVRLSKEGAALLVAENKGKVENIVDLSKEEVEKYFKGNDLKKDLGGDRLVILRFEDNIIGCAKYKQGEILNFLPKIHRGTVIV